LGNALASPDLAVAAETMATIRVRGLTCFDRALVDLSRKTHLPAGLRIASLETLAGRAGPPDPALFGLLAGQLAESAEPMSSLAAARVLGKGPLTSEQLIRLADMLEESSPIVLRSVLPAFAAATEMAVGKALVQSLENSPAASTLALSELDRILKEYPRAVRERARGLRQTLVARQKGKAAYRSAISAELDKLRGDPDSGQELFLSTKLGCFGCHRAAGRGGTVGPDLSRIGKIRSRAELLESIIHPGVTVTPEYRTVAIAIRDGRVASGLVVRDGPESITLRTTDLSEIRIRRVDVEAINPATGSLMPDGLETIMTRQELCDLLEFLTTQR
jgi:putative heme-binding domain-containing protein